MQMKCLNPDYKQEAKAKQVKCLNADYKKIEGEAKKAKHFNPDFKQKETEAMQAKHPNTYYKSYKEKVADRHRQVTTNKNYGRNLTESINIFDQKIQYGCIFVCSVCQQTNFEDTVLPVENLKLSAHSDLLKECLTGYISKNDTEYICIPCKTAIYKGNIPKLSIRNKCGFPAQLIELKLYPLEEQLISPIIPFMTIRESSCRWSTFITRKYMSCAC